MRVIICRVFSMRGLNYRGILLRGFKSVIWTDYYYFASLCDAVFFRILTPVSDVNFMSLHTLNIFGHSKPQIIWNNTKTNSETNLSIFEGRPMSQLIILVVYFWHNHNNKCIEATEKMNNILATGQTSKIRRIFVVLTW